MVIQFFGVRGSCPTPISNQEYTDKVLEVIQNTIHLIQKDSIIDLNTIYERLPFHCKKVLGGNTTCLYIQSQDNQHFIFDMGTGIRQLGNQLARQAFSKEGIELHIFMTHTHWDHIQGWPFFKPAYSPYTKIHFYSTIQNLEERLNRQQLEENFPVTLGNMPSLKKFNTLEEFQEVVLGEVKFLPFYLKHPGSCTGYRIHSGKNSIVFATDVEFRKEDFPYIMDLKKKLGNIDVLIIDAQYSFEEAEQKVGWGHTCVQIAVEVAEILEVKKVILTHYEPDHTDKKIYEIIQEDLKNKSHSVEIIPAWEGLRLEFN